MAISVLLKSGYFSVPEKTAFLGELSLSGDLNPVPGILVMVDSLKELGFKQVFVPWKNAQEASIVEGIDILAVKNLSQVTRHLENKEIISPCPKLAFRPRPVKNSIDFVLVSSSSQFFSIDLV